MPKLPPQILYEDNHLLVINKPAGLATQGVAEGTPSLVTEIKRYLKAKYNKPGNVYLGVVSRLDASTTGVVVLARTSKAAARLSEQFREGTVEKTYWALVAPPPDPPTAELTDWLKKDEKLQRMSVVRKYTIGAQRAQLSYTTLQSAAGISLLSIDLETGRKHQIRLQLANLGSAILGDRKYGSRRQFTEGIALHARELQIAHPISKKPLRFVAPLPASFRKYVDEATLGESE